MTAKRMGLVLALGLLIVLGLRLATVERLDDSGDDSRSSSSGDSREDTPADPHDEPVEAAPRDPEIEDAIFVSGRVVGEGRHPVAGATVELWDGQAAGSATSDAAGRFRIAVAPSSELRRIGLSARDGTGRAAVLSSYVGSRGRDVGVLVMEAGIDVVVEVRDGTNSAIGARVVLAHGPPHYVVPVVETTTDANGRATFNVPPGPIVVHAWHGGKRGRVSARLPSDGTGPLRIDLESSRSVEVLVVEAGTQNPVPGARIEFFSLVIDGRMNVRSIYQPPIDVAPTDATGTTTIHGLYEDESLEVHADALTHPPPREMGRWPRVKPGETSVRIELEAPVTHRWRVVPGERPVPPDGAEIRLTTMPESFFARVPGFGRMEGNELVVTGFGAQAIAIATAPDGSMAMIRASAGRETPEISFRAPRSLDVLFQRADGDPVPGLQVSVGKARGSSVAGPVRTDAEGRVRFDGLLGGRLDVRVLVHEDRGYGGWSCAIVDLDAGSQSIVVTLEPELEIVLRVTVDGKPGLPARYQLGTFPHLGVEEDSVAGELRIRTIPPRGRERLAFTLDAEALGKAKVDVAADDAVSGRIVVDVALGEAGSLDGSIIGDLKSASIGLQRWDAGTETWTYASALRSQDAASNFIRWVGLPAGRYRLFEVGAGLAGQPVDVVAGPDAAKATLDVRGVVRVTGRVEVPEGYAVGDAHVVVGERRRGVGTNGRFDFRAAIENPVRVRAWHPLLIPDPEQPELVVRGALDEVVLRLVAGAVGTVSFDPVPDDRTARSDLARARFFSGDTSDEPIREGALVSTGGAWRFGGVPPGNYTILFDVNGFVPHVLRDVTLGAEPVALGRISLRRGSSIRVRVLVGEGRAAPDLFLTARSLDAPRYVRAARSRGERVIVVSGLRAGRFELTGAGSKRTVTVDGENDVEVELDLR